jgi:hypothetical protein
VLVIQPFLEAKMPFDDTSRGLHDPVAAAPSALSTQTSGNWRQLLTQGGALSLGLLSSCLVLLAARQEGVASGAVASVAAGLVIALWLGTAMFRKDGSVCSVTSTLCLLPVMLIECGWVTLPSPSLSLGVEYAFLAVLFAGALRKLGAEFGARLLRTTAGIVA